ncbi:thiamine transporter 1 isoform X2 [Anabrus simplex]
METWMRISLILCIFGFLKEFRPSEPYITPYLIENKNFTNDQVNREIYPIGTYSYLSLLVVVFLVTDLLRYKPVIIILGLSGVMTWCLLIWGENIPAMQAVEFGYGIFMATEVAYFTYIYAQVDQEHYQKVTSNTRTAFLLGRFLSGVVSQILVSSSAMSYYELNFITLASESVATIWAFFLPPVKHSLYFHRGESSLAGVDNEAATVHSSVGPPDMLSRESPKSNGMLHILLKAYKYLWQDFKHAFSNWYVVKWSIWWALATCGFLQCITYIQNLWQDIRTEIEENTGEEQQLYYAAVEAAYTLIGAATALACGWLKLDWRILGEAALALCSILQGIALLISSFSSSLILAYCLYIIFGVLYHTMITIANSEVAKYIKEDSYGLIFGVNTFFALVLQTILTTIVVEESGLALNPRTQYRVYGGYFLIIGVVFLAMAVYTICCACIRQPKATLVVR